LEKNLGLCISLLWIVHCLWKSCKTTRKAGHEKRKAGHEDHEEDERSGVKDTKDFWLTSFRRDDADAYFPAFHSFRVSREGRDQLYRRISLGFGRCRWGGGCFPADGGRFPVFDQEGRKLIIRPI
jgi:hypothetical protein